MEYQIVYISLRGQKTESEEKDVFVHSFLDHDSQTSHSLCLRRALNYVIDGSC